MKQLFNHAYAGLPVLVTGHTGFKGSWLTAWLLELGADVIGFSLPAPPTVPSNFELSRLDQHITDLRGDVRDFDRVAEIVKKYRPKIIFHLAAQPILLQSLQEPKTTFDTNVGGTINLLETLRQTNCVRAFVGVTTDKVYENQEWLWGYRENDRLGGSDPYSASKAMAELAISSYRDSFFSAEKYAQHRLAIASARAGNVIGGGDFADFRLIPDCIRALIAGKPIQLRNPDSIRPWQHVLEPLSGYLWLGAKLLQEGPSYAQAWNFGPVEPKGISALMITEKLIELWGDGRWIHVKSDSAKAEMRQLRLNWDKAAIRLQWHPVYDWESALAELVTWFTAFKREDDMFDIGRRHIAAYVQKAQANHIAWTQA